jgi:hypothetical protein
MSDERYKEGFKDLVTDASKVQIPFEHKILIRETRRLQYLALIAVAMPAIVVALLFYIKEISFRSESAIQSLILAGFCSFFFLLFLIPSRIAQNRLKENTEHIWYHWRHYLINRVKKIWLLNVGIVFGMASLINVTYDMEYGMITKIIGVLLISIAAIYLMNTFFKVRYKQELKQSNNALGEN